MHIVTVGINYRTAPVEIREKFAIAEDRLAAALQQLRRSQGILECVIIATCNRTEIYAVVDHRFHICGHIIRQFMERWFHISVQEFNPFLYIYENEQAMHHLYRVTCGLDSMVIGETQILGQVRTAFLTAQELKVTGNLFNQLFKQVVSLAKRAHSETSIGENAVSVSYAAIELGKRIFGEFKDKSVMIAGAGKMSELTARHLYSGGVKQVVVVNRTVERARQLSEKLGGIACAMDKMDAYLETVDILISSTGSQGYLLTKARMEKIMRKRRSRPIFMIDIAVPRDLDPRMVDIPGVYLYDIDDLEGIVESNLDLRKQESRKIEAMIAEDIQAYDQWFRTLGIVPLIQALQEKSAHIHQETMTSLFNKLPDLNERERKIILKLTKSIVNQMMQDPIRQMKEAALEPNGNDALAWFSRMFALDEWISSDQPGTEAVRQAALKPQTDKQERERNVLLDGLPSFART